MKEAGNIARLGLACAAVMLCGNAWADGYRFDEPSPFDRAAIGGPQLDGWVRPGAPQAFPVGGAAPAYSFEGGTRMWFSSGKFGYKLWGIGSPPPFLSQLDYTGLTAQSAEVFGKFDVGNGFFLKGVVGGGSISGGKLNDQDFPPAVPVASDTVSTRGVGDMRYLTFDAGYDVVSGGPFRVGGFVGYGYWSERMNTFGCAQVAAGPICTGAGFGSAVDTLDAEPYWNMLRVGGAAAWEFVPGMRLDVDAAYVRGYLGGVDLHNLRPDIRGLPIDGGGNGFMIDAILSWQATDALSFGVGGRWWHVEADGEAHFERTGFRGVAQPLKVEQDRYGLIVQAAYKFGVTSSAGRHGDAVAPSWAGPYVGLNAGYGAGTNDSHMAGTSPVAAATVAAGMVPERLSVRSAGVLAGLTVGYGWQVGRTVYGVEGDVGYAGIKGSTGLTDPPARVATTSESGLTWLGTVRARLGRAFTPDVMAYMTGGAAFGGVEGASDVRVASTAPCGAMLVCSTGSASRTAVGWTAGVGVEVRLNGWASVKTEYLHVDLGRNSVATSDGGVIGGVDYTAGTGTSVDIVRSGLNLRF